MLHILDEQPSVLCQFMGELRDVKVQKDRWRFRKNIERIGEIMAYEISKQLVYTGKVTVTPLGEAQTIQLDPQPVIGTVLRAGLPLQQGFLNFFDHADAAYITAYRSAEGEGGVQVEIQYLAHPSLENRPFILVDPMLATGTSLVKAYREFVKKAHPSVVHIASVIASRRGVEYVRREIPNAHLWVASLDEELNHSQYIVPGLGDAGDLAFGAKI